MAAKRVKHLARSTEAALIVLLCDHFPGGRRQDVFEVEHHRLRDRCGRCSCTSDLSDVHTLALFLEQPRWTYALKREIKAVGINTVLSHAGICWS